MKPQDYRKGLASLVKDVDEDEMIEYLYGFCQTRTIAQMGLCHASGYIFGRKIQGNGVLTTSNLKLEAKLYITHTADKMHRCSWSTK